MLEVIKNSKTLALLALSGLLVFASAPGLASATLAGENGPIVYVEQTEVPCDEVEVDTTIQTQESIIIDDCSVDVTQVVTTTPTGENPVVAAEFGATEETSSEDATTATISPNDASGNHTIVLATEKSVYTCEEYEDDYRLQSIQIEDYSEDEYCYYAGEDAVIYRVQIDKNGNPLGAPTVVTTVSGPEGATTYSNYYVELSYSPDQQNVAGLRFYYAEPNYDVSRDSEEDEEENENVFGPNYVIERINLASGNVEQLVGPKFDPFMNVGYAQSGAIYFTQLVCGEYCPWNDNYDNLSSNESGDEWDGDWEEPNSEVWFFAPNATEATRLTNTSEINEYFLSASPDSKTLLVCDPLTSLYYTVNTATGEVTTLSLEDVENPFLPLFFSPDGKSYLGTMGNRYKQQCGERFLAARALEIALDDEELERGVAVAALADFKNAVIVNGLENPDDWAPIVPTITTTTQVLGTTTTKTVATPKLQSTGSETVMLAVIAGSFITILAGLSFAYRRTE